MKRKTRDINLELLEAIQDIKQGKGKRTLIDLPKDVAQIRYQLSLSQSAFAALMGVSIRTLQEWEQKRRIPSGPAFSLLRIARDNPEVFGKKPQHQSSIAIPIPLYEEMYQRFLKGVLVYRPQEGSDIGRIDMPIAALENPLDGTFDLSRCGDTNQYLVISTGYRKGLKSENLSKVEIWLASRFCIEKDINGSACHLQRIFDRWNIYNQIGIFWTFSVWTDLSAFDYLITESYEQLSNSDNLFEKWKSVSGSWGHIDINYYKACQKFQIYFLN